MADALPLAGKRIVITRPVPQAADITRRLKSLGAEVIGYPLIAIEQPRDRQISENQLRSLSDYDILIFTSRNAVHRMFAALNALTLTDLIPATNNEKWAERFVNHQIAAVGKQTAGALEKLGVVVSIVPDALFNSEALLEHNALKNVSSQRVAIIRGEGGRDLLRNTLLARGATVETIDVYRRVCPVSDLLPLVKCQAQQGIDIIMLTSVEALTHLFRLGAEQNWLKQTTLLVGSQRMADAMAKLEHQGRVLVSDDPGDDQMVNCLLNWVSNE